MPNCGCGSSAAGRAATKAVVTTATGSSAIGDIAGQIASFISCKTNLNMIYSLKDIIYSGVATVFTTIGGYLYFYKKDDSPSEGYIGSDYKPSSIDDTTKIIPSSSKMIGGPENDLMVALPTGSYTFGKAGLNHYVNGDGKDKNFFSLCSTEKTEDNKVNTVTNFNLEEDELVFFCTKISIKKENISIKHYKDIGEELTSVEVCGKDKCSAVILKGNIDITADILKEWGVNSCQDAMDMAGRNEPDYQCWES